MAAGDGREQYARGLQTLVDIGWTPEQTNIHPTQPHIDQNFWNHTIEHLWGRVWARPELSIQERQIVVLSVLTATGTAVGIELHLKRCHETGLNELQVREVIKLTGYYAGWPKMAATTLLFNQWLAEEECNWPAAQRASLLDKGAVPDDDSTDYLELGRKTLANLGVELDNTDLDDEFQQETLENLWGRIHATSPLTPKQQAIVVLATIVWAGDQDSLAEHLAVAQAAGLTEREVREVFIQSGYYSGWPRYRSATKTLNRYLAANGGWSTST